MQACPWCSCTISHRGRSAAHSSAWGLKGRGFQEEEGRKKSPSSWRGTGGLRRWSRWLHSLSSPQPRQNQCLKFLLDELGRKDLGSARNPSSSLSDHRELRCIQSWIIHRQHPKSQDGGGWVWKSWRPRCSGPHHTQQKSRWN